MAKNYRHVGKYILLERLGAGGSGEVYLSYAQMGPKLYQFFAIKLLIAEQTSNPKALKMLQREASLANVLKHNSIVSLYECGQEDGSFFVAMDYVNGLPLSRLMHHHMTRKPILRIEYALYIARAVAAGLEYARTCKDPETGKELSIAHRDISPQNIMVNFEGEVKIIDFGLARSSGLGDKTQSDQVMGKLKYISPEHAGGVSVDHRTDIFSLGVVLWEMLAGRRFYSDMDDAQVIAWLNDPQYKSLRKIVPAVTPELDEIVKKAVAGDIEQRYQTAGALHDALNRYLNKNYPDFSPSEFRQVFRDTFIQDMKDREKMLSEFLIDLEGNQKKHEKTFDEYADMVDRIGVVAETVQNPKANDEKAVERFRAARTAITERKKRVRGMWRHYELKQTISYAWKFMVAFLVLTLIWSKVTNQTYKQFWHSSWSAVRRVAGLNPETRDLASLKAEVDGAKYKYPEKPFTVQIRTRPTGARIYQNGKLLNLKTPALVRVSDAESAKITLESKGFAAKSVLIKPFEEDLFFDFHSSK
ncbi:MAG: serine/threonine protein kinase [Bdellovibrionales bacterium]|nr:serine/threonine protein kinase [Bdellovibrionales bacterium]